MDFGSFIRQDISGIRKDILPLSGFGILSHALADEIAARNQAAEGYFYTTNMEFLDEEKPEQQPELPPVSHVTETVKMDMTLLFKIVQQSENQKQGLPGSTQRMLNRVRTILQVKAPNGPRPSSQPVRQSMGSLTEQPAAPGSIRQSAAFPQAEAQGFRPRPVRVMPVSQMTRQMLVPQSAQLPEKQAGKVLSRLDLPKSGQQMRATRYQVRPGRMKNSLRDPTAHMAVEKMQVPSRQTTRASDHAMLFSDVLHRAQESGLTFAARPGQGGVLSSAQTRAAYTTQVLRQAKAEKAAMQQAVPVWQRSRSDESATELLRTTSEAAKKANSKDTKIPEKTPNAESMPSRENASENRASATPKKGTMSGIPSQPTELGGTVPVVELDALPGAESASAQIENIPAMNGDRAFAQQNPDSVLSAMSGLRYPEADLHFAQKDITLPQTETAGTAAQPPTAEMLRAMQEVGAEALADSMEVMLKEAVQKNTTPDSRTEDISQTVARTAENDLEKTSRHGASLRETSDEKAKAKSQKNTAVQGETNPDSLKKKSVQDENALHFRKTGTSIAKAEQRSRAAIEKSAGRPQGIEETQLLGKIPEQQDEAAPLQRAFSAEDADYLEMTKKGIPPLRSSDAFAKMPDNGAGMYASRYPEAELNFVQESSESERAEMPVPTAQTANAGSRAVEQAGTLARSTAAALDDILKEAVPLVTSLARQEALRRDKTGTEGTKTAKQGILQFSQQSIPHAEMFQVENKTEVNAGTPGTDEETMAPHSPASETTTALQGPVQPERESKQSPIQAESIPDAFQEAAEESVAALKGDDSFAKVPNSGAATMAAPRYPETSLRFVQEETAPEKDNMFDVSGVSLAHPVAETLRAAQEAGAKALAESVSAAQKETVSLVRAEVTAALAQKAQAKRQSDEVRKTVKEAIQKSASAAVQKQEHPINRSVPKTPETEVGLQGAADSLSGNAVGHQSHTAAKKTSQGIQSAGEYHSPRNTRGSGPENASDKMKKPVPLTASGAGDENAEQGITESGEDRLLPLGGEHSLPGQTDGLTQAMEYFWQKDGYGKVPLEYRSDETSTETQEMPNGLQAASLNAQRARAAERSTGQTETSLLWLGEKVAANAARELSRMKSTLPQQAGQAGQPHPAGATAHAAGQMRPSQPIHTATHPMSLPELARWKPGGQTASAQMVSPVDMPELMYQTGASEEGTPASMQRMSGTGPELSGKGRTENNRTSSENSVTVSPMANFTGLGGVRFSGSTPMAGSSPMEAQQVYPALSMEYSSPMSRMEQQLQNAVEQQMSAASRPMGMQTEAGQYMAGKASPGSMKTLDQMSPPPVNEQVVWQNPYMRSAPSEMTLRSKKKEVPQQSQPAPRPQQMRVSDAEIHRMADQVFRIVKDKIRQERRKMGL